MMTTRTWSLCSDLDGVGTAMITSRVMSVPSSAHPRRVANPSRSPRQADFADPLDVGVRVEPVPAESAAEVEGGVDHRPQDHDTEEREDEGPGAHHVAHPVGGALS